MPYNVGNYQVPSAGSGGSDYGGEMAKYLTQQAVAGSGAAADATKTPLTPGQSAAMAAGMGPVSAAFAQANPPPLLKSGYNVSPYFQGVQPKESSSY